MPRKHTMSERVDAFWSKIDRSGGPDACWPWTSNVTPAGYGRPRWGGPHLLAHRIAWGLVNGVIPDGVCALHSCDNPPCCNPAHLFLGSRRDNVADMIAKGRARKATGAATGAHTCPESVARGSAHRGSKLKESDIIAIRAAVAAGEYKTSVARRYSVSDALIGMIVRREAWNHV